MIKWPEVLGLCLGVFCLRAMVGFYIALINMRIYP